jgi:hypothetical protein
MQIINAVSRPAILLIAAVALIATDARVSAAQAGTATPGDVAHSFDIPPQSLDSALAAYTRASGMPLLYDSALTRGRRSNGVRGRMAAARALRLLLEGAGVGVRFTAGGSAVIVELVRPTIKLDPLEVRAAPMIGGAPNSEIIAYAQIVQEEAKAALRRDPALGAASYRMSVKLWIDSAGAISRCAPVSQIEPGMLNRFCEVVGGLRLSRPPPAGLPQPLRIEFRARPAATPTGS